MRVIVYFLFLAVVTMFSLSACMTTETQNYVETGSADQKVLGYGILERIPGQWNGPVMTTTPAGSFDSWYVDFRPISFAEVAQYSNVDADTINYLNFFIVKHEGRLKVAMRTEGVFMGQGCVTYEIIDKVDEEKGYYRFSDFVARDRRAYTEFRFSEDRFIMEVYTNKFNQVSPLEVHTRWTAELGSRKAAEAAADDLGYPRPKMVRDFSDTFLHMSESIYYNLKIDPYKSDDQPYVGEVTVHIAIDDSLSVKPTDELFLLLTTEPLFEGFEYKRENWKYFSKYVFLPPDTDSYTFTNVHPGTYYIYSYNDVNNDKRHLSGDYMSSDFDHSFILKPEGHAEVNTRIDFIIP
jgi:hypothetical protein